MKKHYEHLIPKGLKPGDLIGICAPSGSFDISVFNKGLDIVRKMGFTLYLPDGIYFKTRYLAGRDAHRAEIINSLFSDPDIKGILCARGGFGAMRVLPFLDYERIKSNPKIFVGFSDVTAILATLEQRCGFQVFHGPVITSLASASVATLASFFNILTSPSLPLASSLCAALSVKNVFFSAVASDGDSAFDFDGALASAFASGSISSFSDHTLHLSNDEIVLKKGVSVCTGCATGVLSGGNLATLSHLTGTSFQPDFHGYILFLEDICEPPYKIDRMLTQMKMAGLFDGIRGVLTGCFKDCGSEDMIFAIFEDIFSDFNIPVLAGISAGHGNHNFTLPLGSQITIDSDRHMIM